MRRPSWKASVTPCTFCDPGAAPPMSTWCAEQATKPTRRRPVEEHRHDLVGVGEVAGADEAVVHQDGVAGLQRVGRKVAQHVLGHGRHRAQMAGAEVALRDHDRVAVEQGGGEVVALAHALREGGVAQGVAQLVGDRDEGVPDHRERDGVDAAVLVPTSFMGEVLASDIDDDVSLGAQPRRVAGQDHRRAVGVLDDGGSGDGGPVGKCTPVDDPASRCSRRPPGTMPGACPRGARARRLAARPRAALPRRDGRVATSVQSTASIDALRIEKLVLAQVRLVEGLDRPAGRSSHRSARTADRRGSRTPGRRSASAHSATIAACRWPRSASTSASACASSVAIERGDLAARCAGVDTHDPRGRHIDARLRLEQPDGRADAGAVGHDHRGNADRSAPDARHAAARRRRTPPWRSGAGRARAPPRRCAAHSPCWRWRPGGCPRRPPAAEIPSGSAIARLMPAAAASRVEPHGARIEPVGRDVAEHDVGVGDGRLLAAAWP